MKNSVWKKFSNAMLSLALMGSASLALAQTQPQAVPPAPTSLKASETAVILVDFQGNFVNPDGAWFQKFKPDYDKGMLDKTVKMVNEAREKGAWIIHVTEGYTQDHRELDWTNPGGFHRGQIMRKAWKVGSKEAAYYEPLMPKAEYKDLFLAPRIQVSAFGGTGLNEILRSKGIKNVAVAGFTTDVCVYATVISAYDLGYHVYALRESMLGFFPELSQSMLNSIFPMWSTVIDNDKFVGMVQK
jgi:ureidoacrylate peracid hydrolase